jgi:hypothetical protein
VQTPFAKNRGQLVCLILLTKCGSQTCGLITTTTAAIVLRGLLKGGACNFGQFDLCIWQRVFAHGKLNAEYDTFSPSSYTVEPL